MEIILKIGIGSIRFGIGEPEALEILGAPDKTYFTENECKRIQFNNHLLELSFEPENENRLGWIEIYNPNATIFEYKVIGLEQKLVVNLVSSQITEVPEIEDYGKFISYFYRENMFELQFEFGILKCVNIGVPYNTENLPVWPST
ncbi:hypothetical protein [Cellvibrio sp. pealriver]|uniref:hypothetical protein n=1 Tax=Cellvibrio sp. pealriver TaxID=1622269 RepID=UPI00066FF916|nr:hypothetical protein [Cellvibrio sp. pealriver]